MHRPKRSTMTGALVALALAMPLNTPLFASDLSVEQKVSDHEKVLKQIEAHKSSGADQRVVPTSELGVQDEAFVPGVEGSFCNSWWGYIDGQLTGVVAGYEFQNPLAGKLYIVEGRSRDKPYKIDSPSATGPLCIVSEKNGVLTLKSESGEFERDVEAASSGDRSARFITAPGNRYYHFDLHREEYIKK